MILPFLLVLVSNWLSMVLVHSTLVTEPIFKKICRGVFETAFAMLPCLRPVFILWSGGTIVLSMRMGWRCASSAGYLCPGTAAGLELQDDCTRAESYVQKGQTVYLSPKLDRAMLVVA